MSIRLENISLSLGRRIIFEQLNLRVEPGQSVAILGASGCGKSSLLRVLAGLIPPSSGQVIIGDDHGSEPLRAMVFQEPHLLPWRTVTENLKLFFELHSIPYPKDLADQLLKQLDLEGNGTLYPEELSGGMKMRVSLARALLMDPTLLLLDEPLSALDEINRENLLILIRRMMVHKNTHENIHEKMQKKRLKSMFFVTHSITEALFLADSIYVLKKGQPGWALSIDCKNEHQVPQSQHDLQYLHSKDFFNIVQKWQPLIRSELQT